MKKEADKRTVTHVSENEKIKSASDKRKKKHHKRDVAVAFVVICVVLTCVLIAGIALLKVGSVAVNGNDGCYTDEQIVTVAGISGDSSMLTLREDKISTVVSFALPYIQSVTLERELPDTVHLHVQYAKPAFYVDCGQILLILGADGKILETTQTVPIGIAKLQGVVVTEYTVGNKAVFEDELYFTNAVSVYNACVENELGEIRSVQVSQTGHISVNIENRFYIQSGSVHVFLKEAAVLREVMLERAGKKTAFTFTIAADGSITISNKGDFIEETPTQPAGNDQLNIDSELADSELSDSELSDSELSDSAPAQESDTAPSADAGESTVYDEDSDTLG